MAFLRKKSGQQALKKTICNACATDKQLPIQVPATSKIVQRQEPTPISTNTARKSNKCKKLTRQSAATSRLTLKANRRLDQTLHKHDAKVVVPEAESVLSRVSSGFHGRDINLVEQIHLGIGGRFQVLVNLAARFLSRQ